ncbi:TIGR04197 family type VII secretion effector [Neobacillus vireti]|uniref:TIGR04197 family type VII secretion effector n=1 Tax=Neobacillus vireti TaxID=220686 RepID=UPI003B586DA4
MIQSNIQSAQQIATRMGSASDAIQRATGTPIKKDERTTLIVNMKAQEINQQAMQLAQLFNQSFQQTIQNIQSAAKEFERTDKELENNFHQWSPFSYNEKIKDSETKFKAKNG